jgi:hypothetical protein
MLGKPVPIGYGQLSDEDAGSAAVGVVEGIFTGVRTVDGVAADEYVFFGHAPGQFTSLFIPEGPGLSTGPDYASRVKALPNEYAEVIMPGDDRWIATFGNVLYRDFNSHRYTLAYMFGPRSHLLARPRKVPLVANLWGVEDVGDGTGNVITSLALQVLHFLANFVLQNYTSGAWSIPSFNGYSQLRTSSFGACQTRSATRLGTADGHLGAWLLGWDAIGKTLPELIRIFADHALDLGINKEGQIVADMVDPAKTLNRSIVDVTDVLKRSFRAPRQRTEIASTYVYRYARRYTPALNQQTPVEGSALPPTLQVGQTDWIHEPAPLINATAVSKYGTRKMELNLELTRDPATADDLAAYHDEIRSPGPRTPTFDERLCGTDTDLGFRDELDHFEGVTATGYTDRSLRCEVHELDLQTFNVRKEYLDLDGVSS